MKIKISQTVPVIEKVIVIVMITISSISNRNCNHYKYLLQ